MSQGEGEGEGSKSCLCHCVLPWCGESLHQALFMIGSVRTLEQAKMGPIAAETLPQGGAKVLRDYMRHLKEEDLILRAD
jgi:hypothetical protein